MSRRIAAELYDEIIHLRPEWRSDDLDNGVIKVVMTTISTDGAKMQKHHTTKTQRKALVQRMKDEDDPLKIVIVRDMWLTGFDAPYLNTMYIDKPMKDNLYIKRGTIPCEIMPLLHFPYRFGYGPQSFLIKPCLWSASLFRHICVEMHRMEPAFYESLYVILSKGSDLPLWCLLRSFATLRMTENINRCH